MENVITSARCDGNVHKVKNNELKCELFLQVSALSTWQYGQRTVNAKDYVRWMQRVEVKVKVSIGEALQNMLMYDVTVEWRLYG